jgi:hypothetical protein
MAPRIRLAQGSTRHLQRAHQDLPEHHPHAKQSRVVWQGLAQRLPSMAATRRTLNSEHGQQRHAGPKQGASES